jgi:hypothetical protein
MKKAIFDRVKFPTIFAESKYYYVQPSCFPDSCKDCNLYNHQIFSVCNKLLTNGALRVSDRSLTAANFMFTYLLLCSSWTHLWKNRSFPKNKIWCLPVQYINHHANFCDWNEDVDCVFPPPGMLCSSHRISGLHLHPS